MATENAKVNTRIQLKHDIAANWAKAENFIPLAGEVIIYDVDEINTIMRFKVGNGLAYVNDLPFVDFYIDYNDLSFDVDEIVIGTSNNNSSILGQAMLGYLRLA